MFHAQVDKSVCIIFDIFTFFLLSKTPFRFDRT